MKKIHSLVSCLFVMLIPFNSFAQKNTKDSTVLLPDTISRSEKNLTFEKVETGTWFRTGDKNAALYISEEINKAKRSSKIKETGLVTLSFIIEKNGSISSTTVKNSSSEKLTKLSLDILAKMPKWKPALQGGKQVRMMHKLNFQW
jgi:hypothetical protein